MATSVLQTKLGQMRELINTTVANKVALQSKLSHTVEAGSELVAQYLSINIQELSRISADLLFVDSQMRDASKLDNDWRASLAKMVELITKTIDRKSDLLQKLKAVSEEHPVAKLLDDNIQELRRIQADLSESIVLSNV